MYFNMSVLTFAQYLFEKIHRLLLINYQNTFFPQNKCWICFSTRKKNNRCPFPCFEDEASFCLQIERRERLPLSSGSSFVYTLMYFRLTLHFKIKTNLIHTCANKNGICYKQAVNCVEIK